MQTMPPKPPPPYHVRVHKLTAYSLVANILLLVAIAASGALAPYAALHAVGGARLVSLVLPTLPRFAGPLVSGLAGDVAGSRAGSPAADVDRIAAADAGASRIRPAGFAPPSAVTPVPAPPVPATVPGGGNVTPGTGGETTSTPVTPPAEETATPVPVDREVTVVRPEKSQGNAFGVVKHAATKKPRTVPPATGKSASAKKAPQKKPSPAVSKAAAKAVADKKDAPDKKA